VPQNAAEAARTLGVALDKIGGDVLLGFLSQSKPSLGHGYEQGFSLRTGCGVVCDGQALFGVTPIRVYWHEFLPNAERI
jgi:hypothetical protein